MTALPPCDYRVDTAVVHRYFCQHPLVIAPNSVVPATVCRLCRSREIPRDDRRPVTHVSEELPPPMPSWTEKAWNLSQALTDFVADGLKLVSREDYERRLRICDSCDQRVGDNCQRCGCQLKLKARGRAFQCPLGHWPKREPETQPA